ncbi:hypothetical protein RCO28_27575 [Streptomyces sp. LHD-70]|uniref:hypothetical protein n=1 Tax=Streptomyces sp. LHD-70 TaxID=3072140 RepID=UPI00280E3AA0|nr:hypothetical protein [Streptomyces sp. LHD-70]MDQ8706201.1 hypothetical protein [Streptomyces sp. LHD-70]
MSMPLRGRRITLLRPGGRHIPVVRMSLGWEAAPRLDAHGHPSTWETELDTAVVLYARGCVVRRLDQDNENGRYIADEMQQDAVANSSWWWNYSLTSAETYMIYEGEQEIVKYEPQSDVDLAGSCAEVNVGLQGSSGVMFGISKQICGDQHGPVQRPDDEEMTLGFGWSGFSDPGDDVAAIGTTLVRVDSLVGATSTLRNKVEWTWY